MNKIKSKIFSFIGIGSLLFSISCKTQHKLIEVSATKEIKSDIEQTPNDIDALDTALSMELDSLNYSTDSLVIQDDSAAFYQASRDFKSPVLKNISILQDPPMLELLERETNAHYAELDFALVDESKYGDYAIDFIPELSDSQIQRQLDSLNKQTTIELTYNSHVKRFIHVYSKRSRGLTSRMLGLGEIYFPQFEASLAKYDIPLEMKYLAIVESALNPTAGSRMGASGLWQFMYATGKRYGLNVTTLIDDRYDPAKSTEAACAYLSDLYSIYKDWSLALAAYNSGPGNVNKAIRRAGGVKNYWAIWPFLPKETRSYVPAFIAVTYVMNFPEVHNIRPSSPGINYSRIDTVTVKDILAFDQLNEFLNIPLTDLKFLNPQYKKGIIPATNGKKYALTIPREYVPDFMNNEDSLYRFITKKGVKKEQLLKEIKKVQGRNVHIVRSGESLGVIARKYRCSVSSLKKWNRLRSNMIKPGQRLTVYGSAAPSSNKSSYSSSKSSTGTHQVKSGESLGSIARKYGLSLNELKAMNKLNGNLIRVKQQLKVRKVQVAESKKISFPKNGKKVKHTIKNGENLWLIAKKHPGSSVKKILQLNDIKDTQKLKAGMVIVVDII